jgi:hypothetical protein
MMLLAVCLLLPLAGQADGADFTFKPRISTSMEYNDNVTETQNARGDYLWIVKPGFSATYDHSRVYFDVSYDFENKKYLNEVKSDEENNYLKATGEIEAIKDLFFINVSDDYRLVYQNATRGEVEEGDTSVGTTDQNTFNFDPYFVIPLQERTSLRTGGGFQDIWYSEEGSVDKRIYSLYADVNHELTDRWSITGGGRYQKQDPRWEEDGKGFDRYNLNLGTTYSYAERSYIELNIKPTYTEYEDEDSENQQYIPYFVGITHAFTPTLIGNISSSMDFTEDPESSDTKERYVHQAGLTEEYERGNFNVSIAYYDYENDDSSDNTVYWRPSIRGTHSLTERLSFNYNAYMNLYTDPDSRKTIFSLFGLSYSLTETTSTGLSYRFKMNDEQSDRDDYISNSVALTLTWHR